MAHDLKAEQHMSVSKSLPDVSESNESPEEAESPFEDVVSLSSTLFTVPNELDLTRLDELYLEINDDEDEDLFEFENEVDATQKSADSLINRDLVGKLVSETCEVCLLSCNINLRLCCGGLVCSNCMKEFINFKVNEGMVRISCPCVNCNAFIHRDEILFRLDDENKDKFYRFLVNANQEPHIKTCPRCNTVMKLDGTELKDRKDEISNEGLEVTCADCSLHWCFPCQAPWHEGMKCREYKKGDKLLRNWAKKKQMGNVNAQKCPKCKIFIQRSSGCDHMQCSKCNTSFCYRCGGRFHEFKYFGNHFSKLSILGCKYRLFPNNSAKRRLIRGSVFGTQILAATVGAGLICAAGAVVVGFSVVILPAYGLFKLKKWRAANKARKQRRIAHEEWNRRIEEYRNRRPVSSQPEGEEGLQRMMVREALASGIGFDEIYFDLFADNDPTALEFEDMLYFMLDSDLDSDTESVISEEQVTNTADIATHL